MTYAIDEAEALVKRKIAEAREHLTAAEQLISVGAWGPATDYVRKARNAIAGAALTSSDVDYRLARA